MLVGLDSFFIELFLRFAAWDKAVFGDKVAEAEGCLTVLAGAFEMCVSDSIAELLQIGVWACLETFVEFGLVVAVFDAEVNDFARGFRIGKVEGRCTIEFDILGWDANSAREEVAFNVENFHGEAARLGNAVVETGIARLGAVAADDWVLCAVIEHTLLEVFG